MSDRKGCNRNCYDLKTGRCTDMSVRDIYLMDAPEKVVAQYNLIRVTVGHSLIEAEGVILTSRGSITGRIDGLEMLVNRSHFRQWVKNHLYMPSPPVYGFKLNMLTKFDRVEDGAGERVKFTGLDMGMVVSANKELKFVSYEAFMGLFKKAVGEGIGSWEQNVRDHFTKAGLVEVGKLLVFLGLELSCAAVERGDGYGGEGYGEVKGCGRV